ncbi:MAG: glycoside hydrolase family 2 TIM barrel-domain containing protein [Bryobacteraceae bacterium]
MIYWKWKVIAVCACLWGASVGQAQTRIELSGKWERYLGGKRHDTIDVPSSYRPIGTVTLRRSFTLPAISDRRVLIRFEGITHHAEVNVNGRHAGSMGPWTPYDFDVTGSVHPGGNQIEVELTDWQVPLGPIGGWESSGGIIRDVYAEMRADPYIENVHLEYNLAPALDSADCTARVSVRASASAKGRLSARLLRDAVTVAETSREVALAGGSGESALSLKLTAPELWSPENPNLYTLRVSLNSPAGDDTFTTSTGFRDLKISGNRFLLNGRTVVLHGVCRHDLWPNQGHTLSQAQIEQDLTMIKSMGANFVRLVHYPHDRRVVETAARVGLFVTEETGLVWVDFSKLSRETIETGIGNLERAIHRDWNNPALFAVLLANESAPTLEVIREARSRVRAIAPKLFMSSARVDSPEHTQAGSKRLFDEGGLDFYTDHPYTYEMEDIEKSAAAFPGKPLFFTEWGGRAVGQSPVLMRATTEQIGKLVESGKVAGYSFWSWADLPQFSRKGEEMEGGILKSGVVTEEREPREDVYLALMNLFRKVPHEPAAPSRNPELLRPLLPPLSESSRFTPISLQEAVDDPAQARAWGELEAAMKDFWETQGLTSRQWEDTGRRLWLWNAPQLELGRFPFHTPTRAGMTEPLVLSSARSHLEIPVGTEADRLLLLGNVTMPDGYPVMGRFGAAMARYTVVYADGERQEVPLRWGQEIARSNTISVGSRIDPATAEGERVLLFAKDPVREVYQARLLEVRTRRKKIDRIECDWTPSPDVGLAPPASMHHAREKPGPERQALLIFGVTAEITQ